MSDGSSETNWDAFDLDWLGLSDGGDLETTRQLADSRVHKRRPTRRRDLRVLKRTQAAEFLTELPEIGETWHVVSNAKYDFWTWVAVFADLLGGRIDELYGSTWTMSRINVQDLFEQHDAGRIGTISLLTGVYFKRRESSVYAQLIQGMAARGYRFICFENHTKVLLMKHEPHYIVIEGSANFTSNPRLEQYTITNDAGLYEFHRAWMEEMLNGEAQGGKPKARKGRKAQTGEVE